MARNFKKEQAEKLSTRAIFSTEDRFWFLWKMQRVRDGRVEIHTSAGDNGGATFLARAKVTESGLARDPETNAILPGYDALAWASRFPGWEITGA